MPRPVITSPQRKILIAAALFVNPIAIWVVRACQDGQTARSALGVAAITSSISLAGRRAASRARTARATASGSMPGSWIHGLVDACAEPIEALRRAMCAGAPAFIIEAAQQRGQMRAEIHDHVARQRIAQSVQRADQRGIGLAAIVPTQALRQIIDPGVRFGDGAADFRNLSQPTGPCFSICKRSQSSSLPRASMAGSCI